MPDPQLDVLDRLSGRALIPEPVERLGGDPELDDEIVRKVLRLDLAALLAPQPDEGRLVVAHDDPGIGTANEVAAIGAVPLFAEFHGSFHQYSLLPTLIVDHELMSDPYRIYRLLDHFICV